MSTTKENGDRITENPQQAHQIQAAIDYGIDLQMLVDNAKRTPAERIRRHQIALNTAEKLRKADHK
ncbi:MAG: hypothetical protein KAY65_04705 [Planctomycetes bacterium]|nr:hypothetical protein [Planctomycetota bacterium]